MRDSKIQRLAHPPCDYGNISKQLELLVVCEINHYSNNPDHRGRKPKVTASPFFQDK